MILLISQITDQLRIIYKLAQPSEQLLNSILCGFRKNHSTHHALFKRLHYWQRIR